MWLGTRAEHRSPDVPRDLPPLLGWRQSVRRGRSELAQHGGQQTAYPSNGRYGVGVVPEEPPGLLRLRPPRARSPRRRQQARTLPTANG